MGLGPKQKIKINQVLIHWDFDLMIDDVSYIWLVWARRRTQKYCQS